MVKQKPIDYGLFTVTLALYAFLGFVVKRDQTLLLLGAYAVVFLLYIYIAFRRHDDAADFWFYASVAFRGMLLFSIPGLSDDFYRFIWDGRLLAAGRHPFLEIPSYYLEHDLSIPGIDRALFEKLNSPEYFTIYPPVAQFIFWLSAKLSPNSIHGSVLVIKLFILLSEIATLHVIRKLLIQFSLPSSRVLLYALNPLVILELSGNIHLEAILILFLLLSILLLGRKKLLLSAASFSVAVCVKLIPLVFLPALLPGLKWKKFLAYSIIVVIVSALLFIPLMDESIVTGFQSSLGYYFKKFEFNASIYYLVREFGYWYFGYNIIQTAGWQLGIISGLMILLISFRNFNTRYVAGLDADFFRTLLFVLFSYFLFTTTLHPWYITTLFALSIFTEFRFTLVWTAMIFLTYSGYHANGFKENLWLIAFEYISVLGYLAFELLWKRKELR